MALLPPFTAHDSDRQIAKRPDHAFGSRLRGGLGAAGRIQAHQFRTLFLQRRAQPLFGQGQHAQGQAQQPDQPGDACLVAQKDRAELQIAGLQAAEAALMHRLLVIGGDQGRHVVLVGGGVRHIDLPAQPLHHRLPGDQVNPNGRDDPGRAAIAQVDRLQRRLHHSVQFGLRNARGHHLGQIGLVRIAFAPACRRLRQLQQIQAQALQGLFAQPAHPGLIGARADEEHALGPAVEVSIRRVGPGLGAQEGMDDRLHLQFARAAVDRLDTHPGVRLGQGGVHPSCNFRRGVDGAIDTQIAAPVGDDMPTGRQVAHLAVADDQHGAAAQGRDRRIIGGHIQAVIGVVARDGLATDWQPKRVEGGEHELELAQVGAMILAVAMLEQAVGRHVVVVDADAGAVQTHRFAGQAVDAHPALQQGGIERGLGGRVAKHGQERGQAVVGTIGVPQRDRQQGVDGLDAIGGPVAHRHQAMVALLEDMAQPDAQHGAHAGAVPVAMRPHMRVDHVPNAHIDNDAEQQRQAVDLLVGDREGWWCHAARIPQHGPNLASQIRES